MSTAKKSDAEKAAALFLVDKNLTLNVATELFEKEFSYCESFPDLRIYFTANFEGSLIGYAGARRYDSKTDENMYQTSELLPSGWYLRGLKVHPDWRKKGLGRAMTLKRLEWISTKSSECYVFLAQDKFISMYFELGFKLIASDLKFEDGSNRPTEASGKLLRLPT